MTATGGGRNRPAVRLRRIGIPFQVYEDLKQMGHPVHSVSGFDRSLFARGQVILRDAETGVLCGGSDPRADGCAMALA